MGKLLEKEEREKITKLFNNTKTPYSYDKTVIDFFQEVVEKYPDNTAVIFNDKKYSYRELNICSNKLAYYLRTKGIGANDIVALVVERSFEMMVGIFAVLKAGGAYLPIDPDCPESRKRQIISDSKAKYVLTLNKFIDQVPADIAEVIDLNCDKYYIGDGSNPQKITKPKDIAYVIYTSGSTGKPKGVLIEHHSLVNRLQWMQKKYKLDSTDVILQKTTYTFDVSVWEILWCTLTGAAVCLLKPKKEHDVRAFAKLIEKYNVSVIHFVPSVLRIFLDYVGVMFDMNRLKSLKWVFASGEILTGNLVNRFNDIFSDYKAVLVNLYGPTEATIDVTYFACEKNKKYDIVPIGKPIDNIYLYILNDEFELLPIGEEGELYISGAGVAKGYLNNLDLTSKKFVENPFIKNTKMYSTGDIAKWNNDGQVIYIGRKDGQVKLRGLRIELGEVEYHISSYEPVEDSVVCVREDESGNQFLTAYIILSKGKEGVEAKEIKDYLKTKIQAYMIPSNFIFLDEFPLKPNGKVDRKKLNDMY